MDGRGFDAFARRWGAGASRRGALRLLLGGALGAALAPLGLGPEGAAAGTTRGRANGRGCQRDRQCVSDRCRNGVCRCLRPGADCVADNACCSGSCRPGGCTRK